jgi:DNA repair protein SbcD/Mre11
MRIIHFADLHLGVESYGHFNPESGLSSRLEDYLKALDQVVDFALQNKIDLVLFCGDAYKTREPSQTQQREFAKRIRHLSEGGVPLLLLTGNHDLPNALGRATAVEIFDTLEVPGVYVANRPCIHKVRTTSGILQVAALPWLRRSALLSRDDSRNLDFNQINERLQETLTRIIYEQVSQLDPSLPSILAAHVWVLNATLGTEKSMSIGQEHMLLLSSVAQPAFDYVALGHIHKGQVLNDNPPVVYSGSLERLDFGDENDEKGFYLVEIEELNGKRQTKVDFHPVQARRFFTLSVQIEPDDLDPTSTVIKAIEANQARLDAAVVRIEIKLPAALSSRLREGEIRRQAASADYLIISRDVQRESRLRLAKSNMEGITPQEALKAYLESKFPPERAKLLYEYGERLIQEHSQKSEG